MQSVIKVVVFISLLFGAIASHSADTEAQWLNCAQQSMAEFLVSTSDKNDAISMALAHCHQLQSSYSEEWVRKLEHYGFSATEHLATLAWIHSYRTVLSRLNQIDYGAESPISYQ